MSDLGTSTRTARLIWWAIITFFCVLFTFPFYVVSPFFVLTFWLPVIAILSFGSVFKSPSRKTLLLIFIIAGLYTVIWQRNFGYMQYCEQGFFGLLGCPTIIAGILFIQAVVFLILLGINRFRDKFLRFFSFPMLIIFLGITIFPYLFFAVFYNANEAVNGNFDNGAYDYAHALWTGDKSGVFSQHGLDGFKEPSNVMQLMAPYSSWQWKGYCRLVQYNIYSTDITNNCFALGALHFNDESFCANIVNSKSNPELSVSSLSRNPIQFCI
ncbi:MAG: hypothetical protein ABIP54_00960, partial [Candidatus Andersenbacteria bacterium]